MAWGGRFLVNTGYPRPVLNDHFLFPQNTKIYEYYQHHQPATANLDFMLIVHRVDFCMILNEFDLAIGKCVALVEFWLQVFFWLA